MEMNDSTTFDICDSSTSNAIWSGLRRLYSENKLFDVVILAQGGEIRAHKVVLASSSVFFKLLFTSDLSAKSSSTVDLSFCDLKALKPLIHYLYTGEISFNQNNIFKLVELQDFLGIDLIRHHLVCYMLNTITDENCWRYHKIADCHGYYDVFIKVDRYIKSNFSHLVYYGNADYLHISPEQLCSFFESDFLSVSNHENLLLGLCKWLGEFPEERMNYFESLMENVNVARLPSWRGVGDKMVSYFCPEHHHSVIEWAERVGKRRDLVNRRRLKGSLSEIVLLIGGYIDGVAVSSIDACIPPIVYPRCIPMSEDQNEKQYLVIPSMLELRCKPTVVSTPSSVYALGGVDRHEELKAKGISCEVFKLKDNNWFRLPNLPPSKTLRISRNRKPPAAVVDGKLYVALPSPRSSFWVLSRNEISWVELKPPNSEEVHDLVGVNSAVYCIGRTLENCADHVLERYDSFGDNWVKICLLPFSLSNLMARGLYFGSILYVATSKHWHSFNPSSCVWKKEVNISLTGVPCESILCAYKDKQIICVHDDSPIIEVLAANKTKLQFYLPGRSSFAMTTIAVPIFQKEPI